MAHMQMSWPFPLHSSLNPATPEAQKDYSMTEPLNKDGSNFPCKGYQNDRPVKTTVTWNAGSTYNMTLAGSATHLGGSCQLSLSYDNGAAFRVIKSMIGGCPLTSTYDFTIPSFAPSGTALFAWTWQNFEGNREFYMNCAEVAIVASPPADVERKRQAGSMDALPYIWKANLVGINTCATTEQENPVYPHPGTDVLYGGGMSSSSPASPGTCDEPTPYGQTYKDLRDSSTVATGSGYIAASPVDAASSGGSSSSAEAASPSPSSSGTSAAIEQTVAMSVPLSSSAPGASGPVLEDGDPPYSPPMADTSSTVTVDFAMVTTSSSSGPTETGALATSSFKAELRELLAAVTATGTGTGPCGPATVYVTVTASSSSSSVSMSMTSGLSPSINSSISASTSTTASASPSSNTTMSVASSSSSSTNLSMSITSTSSTASTATSSAALCTGTTATCPCTSGYACVAIASCTWACAATSASASSASPASSSSATSVLNRVASPSGPAYVPADASAYLPCVPGTFLCTSNSTFLTCDGSAQNASAPNYAAQDSDTTYQSSRSVAAGMECLPFLSPYANATSAHEQQADVAAGYYRDDRYVRATPYGSCGDEGAIECRGNGFLMCDMSGWVDMGSVAAGTVCTGSPGMIVAA